ncbi:MAG TPA: efflux transporter outer membrane subunit [Methylocella sp.]|nr:efflux transporter outer membrane subunit [Methylocella sp.]
MGDNRAIAAAGLFGFVLSVSGCTVGPDFETPGAEVQNNWIEMHDARVKTKESVRARWWEVFKDPTLDELIERASQQNLTVQIAGLRILEARAQLGVAIGNLYPQTQEGFGDAQTIKLSSRLLDQANFPHYFANFDLGFDAAWELDFWGRFRRNVEANDAAMLATAADYENALVSLTAEVARTYTEMRTFEVLIQIARENVKTQREGLDIAQSRFRNGATSELDVTQARSLLENTLADIPQLQANLQQTKNALNILLGQPPGGLEAILRGPHKIPLAPRKAAIGLPAELLRRRPDIRSAELNAAAEAARIGVAEADLYPRLFLAGEIGVQASDAAKLFAPGSLLYTAGPGFRWSILNYGRITNNVRAQDARFQQALVNYENTVLKAAREVEDALVGFLKAQESAVDLQRSVNASRSSVDLATIQYQEGAENFQRVIDSQTRLLTEMNRLAETRSSIATNLIAVYKALGGGWEVGDDKPIVSEALQVQMASRTDWGNLLPPPPPPRPPDLNPPPSARATSAVLPPDW